MSPQKGRVPGVGGGPGMLRKIIIVAAGGVMLLIVGIIVSNVLSSSGKGAINDLKGLAAEQAEIIRVSDLGVKSAKSADTKNIAATTSLVVRTMQQRTLKLISIKGGKITTKEQASRANSETDEALKSAEQSNRYDEVFNQFLVNELTKYQSEIKTAYDSNVGENDRDVLGAAFTGTSLILENQQL